MARAKVVGTAVSGDRAATVIETPDGRGCRYFVSAIRTNGVWHEGGACDGYWLWGRDGGVLSGWGDDGGSARSATIRYEGQVVTVPVVGGIYVFVMHDVPAPFPDYDPTITFDR